ncbi:cell division protein FtsQ/DivIB [Dethiobacter alkaliphilus]|uniref:cell division protein FtsQ/DivIB n=1 Tax=Dethiobacter alkaliphilus TaxID=427926 RepID=UPI002226D8D3|nr:FtsQ-type POTRA domain-containing protein [Dethiobacter alkaliphilus]MCW3491231.1 FtsQ-type POTRA domain-containing protein [Dethiobacter alkaliphilus]
MDKQLRKRRTFSGKQAVSPEKVKKVRRRLLGFLLLLMMIWLILGFVRSDFFQLEEIIISGNTHTTESEIRDALVVAEGVNIWQLNPARLQEKVAAIPRIAEAEVSRRLPRGLEVDILEKEAMALVPYRDYLLEIGYDGMVLGTTQDPKDYGRPLLTGLGPVELAVGNELLSGTKLEATAEAMRAMEEEAIALSEVNLGDEENVVVVTLDGMTVWLGRGEFSQKASLLKEIMGQLPVDPAEGYLDLRVTRAPNFHVLDDDKTQKNN